MTKVTVIVIAIVMLVTITLGSVATMLTNEKYHLTALVLMNGWEICELTDEEITFNTETKNVTLYDFEYGIRQIKNGAY